MRVVTVTPAGRRRYLRILAAYLLSQRHVIARHQWWLNTSNTDDIAYIHKLCSMYPKFFSVQNRGVFSTNPADGIWQYQRMCRRPDTLYIRLDDDIVWMHPDAISNMARYREANRRPFLVSGNIVNNAVCTYRHYHHSRTLPTGVRWPFNQRCCPVAWSDPHFAEMVHRVFLLSLRRGTPEDWYFDDVTFSGPKLFSVNVISWLGSDMARVREIRDRVVRRGEEPFMTNTVPSRTKRNSDICGDALFAHYAYYPQRPYIEGHTDILEEYLQIADEAGLLRAVP